MDDYINESYLDIAEAMTFIQESTENNLRLRSEIIEPIMKVQVVVPDEYLGNVMGDITSRRGRPLGQESRGNALAIDAMVPLAEMFGYATSLRSNTQGRGTFTMVFDHYEETPRNITEQIIKKNGSNND